MSIMITSKDIIAKTGISRATLNNYIKLGILPRPVVGPPRPGDHSVKQIGYFPEEVLARLDRLKVLKRQGKTMDEISRLFQPLLKSEESSLDTVENETPGDAEQERSVEPYTRFTDSALKVTICDIHSPAYLLNHDLEIEWINKEAEEFIFHKRVRSLIDSRERNIFRLLLGKKLKGSEDSWIDLTSLHLTVLQKQVEEVGIAGISSKMSANDVTALQNIFNSRNMLHQQQACLFPVSVSLPDDILKNYLVYAMNFREGIFFVYIPDDATGGDLPALLGQRKRAVGKLLKRKMPTSSSLCVLVSSLQDSEKISAQLLPDQYFELINGLWECVGSVFDKYNGVYGKHVGDGVLYYFLDSPGDHNYINNCINCAIDLREVVSFFSERWKGAKEWDNDLFLNTGINEGQEFFGTIRSADNIEFTALGDTTITAARLSEFAQNGQIWTSKNLVNKLNQEERNKLRFGVHKNNNPANRFIRDSFSRVADLVLENNSQYRHFCRIAELPITEIKERIKPLQE